eukprot:278939_1
MDDILQKVEELNNKEADEFEPYKFKYEARDILEKSIKDYETNLQSDNLSKDAKESLTTEYMILKHHLAINYSDTEERSKATPILPEIISYFTQTLTIRMKYVLILMKSLNYLAIIWSSLSEEKKSKKYLDQSEQLYSECRTGNNIDLINSDINALEREYTHTLFYFAQLYKNLGNNEKSAIYCHKTLQRQLKYDKNALDRKDWVVNALNLSSFFINNSKFRQAIHCIEAACKISESISPYTTDNENDENIFDDEEEQKRMKADIEKSWGILYTELLKKSYEINSTYQDQKDAEKDAETDEKALENTQELIALDEKLKLDNSINMFDNIELKQPPKMELASTYNEAKELFIPGLNHLMNAIGFYVLDGFVTDHTKIAQHISTIYKYLAFFEQDKSTKCKLHKRRINLLKDIEAQLSVNAYEDLVQDLCYELGSIYENMGSLKKDILDAQDKSKEVNTEMKQIKKINDLYSKAVHYLTKYVNIFEYPPNAQSKEMQEIPEQYRFEYFQAHFLMSVLYGKLIGGNKTVKIENLKKSLSGYQHIVQFYDKKGPIDSCKIQYTIAKEMKDLLPLKISSMHK